MAGVKDILIVFLLVLSVTAISVVAAPGDSGKWDPEKYGKGHYVHEITPYVNDRKPYDGGFGEYVHDYVPYEDRTLYKANWKLYNRCKCW